MKAAIPEYGFLAHEAQKLINSYKGSYTLYFNDGFIVYPNSRKEPLKNTSLHINKSPIVDDCKTVTEYNGQTVNIRLRSFKLLTEVLFEKIQVIKEGIVFTKLEDSAGNILGRWTGEEIEAELERLEKEKRKML